VWYSSSHSVLKASIRSIRAGWKVKKSPLTLCYVQFGKRELSSGHMGVSKCVGGGRESFGWLGDDV